MTVTPFAGFLVGLLVGLTGVGGGALMTPLLIFLFGVAPQTAVGTDLLFAFITKSVGGWIYGRHGAIDWRVFRRLALGSVPSSAVTLLWLHTFRLDAANEHWVLQTLGIMLALTSVAMLFKARLHHLGQRVRTETPIQFKAVQPALTVVTGVLIGCLVTLTSVGAGALGAAALLYLYPYRLTPAKLVGTDIAHATALTLVAGLGHVTLGHLDVALLGALLAGSIPGVMLGARLSTRIDARYLRGAIAAILMLVGGRMWLQG
ncbi:membrane protein [Pandoraea terrae]|uniref:Probable membrane transporter protein n=2 Tax=Pandoraea terrae TaxID=1537710 RepID=A0A5E4Z2G4_9BURK|nr:membrane protein [Pandoraea terrae]